MRAEIETIYKNCLMSQGEELITARTIYQYCISPFMVYCDAFGPEDKMDPPTRYQEMLFAQGREHEKNVIETNYPDSEELEYKTQEEGFKLLLKSMSEGSKVICGLPVFYLPEGLMGIFDVLEKKNAKKSIFGRYHYVVKEIKLARNIQDHHIYQAAFYNYLLGKIQGYTSPVFYLYNRDSEEIEVEYDEQELLEKITDIRKILKGKKV
jgi:predicted RecB family nuclease